MLEAVIKKLNSKNLYLDHLGQFEDGRKWSATVRKKGTTATGYGVATNCESAIKKACGAIKDSWDPKSKDTGVKNPVVKKRKRAKL